MITREMIENKTLEEVAQMLKDNCARTEEQMVKRYFSEDEMADMRVDLSDRSIARNDLQEELKNISKDLKDKIKAETTLIKNNLKDLKKKYTEQKEVVYLMDDQEAGRMYYYSVTGDLLSDRKLLPSEKQTRIREIRKSA